MGCITILRRSLFPPDPALFQRAFEVGLLAVGSRLGDRVARVLGGRDCFHVMLDPGGPGLLDCHAYAVLATRSRVIAPGARADAIRSLLEGQPASITIESSPVEFSDVAFRRVAAAVAALLDSECLAVIDEVHRRIVACTPETVELLRGSDAGRAFADGVDLAKLT